jgi:hypothetical protein
METNKENVLGRIYDLEMEIKKWAGKDETRPDFQLRLIDKLKDIQTAVKKQWKEQDIVKPKFDDVQFNLGMLYRKREDDEIMKKFIAGKHLCARCDRRFDGHKIVELVEGKYTRTFCSNKCMSDFNRPLDLGPKHHPPTCEQCGNEILVARVNPGGNHRFCSSKCAGEYYDRLNKADPELLRQRLREQAEGQKEPETWSTICDVCHGPAKKCIRVAVGEQRLACCSKECAQAAEHRDKARCAACGLPFPPGTHQAITVGPDYKLYCSPVCRNQSAETKCLYCGGKVDLNKVPPGMERFCCSQCATHYANAVPKPTRPSTATSQEGEAGGQKGAKPPLAKVDPPEHYPCQLPDACSYPWCACQRKDH